MTARVRDAGVMARARKGATALWARKDVTALWACKGATALWPRDGGAAALLGLLSATLSLLIALVVVVAVADLVISRGQAQIAADAAALAAMGVDWPLAGDPPAARAAAARLARRNGGRLLRCCGDEIDRRVVEVGVVPRSSLLAVAVPLVRARAAAGLVPSSPGTGAPIGTPSTAAPTGQRIWPVSGRLSSGFGHRRHPVHGTVRMHTGLDIAAPAGTPIRAAASGVVTAAGARGGYGLTVDIDHGGVSTRYAHQARLLVRAGQAVAAGQVIGVVGSTGVSTGPHLHFEVRTPAGAVDPGGWLPPRR